MPLLGAALTAQLILGDPVPLADRVAAERARNTALPPHDPPLPARLLPHLRKTTEGESDCSRRSICQLVPLRKASDVTHPDYPALLLRLVTHYDEKRTYHLDQANYLDEEIAARPHMAPQLRIKQASHRTAAKQAAEQLLKFLKTLVTTPQLPPSPLIEEAHYFYILELTAPEQRAELLAADQQFTQLYPHSPYRPHLDIAAAHHALARRELTAARALYARVLASSARELHPHAHLGLGWSYLRSESGEGPNPDLALAAFTRALELTSTDELLPSIHDGLVHAFAAAGRPDRAPALFTRLAALPQPRERRAITLQERLALAYFARGQHRESARVYRDLRQHHPDDPANCAWQHGILLTAAASLDPDATLREAEHLGAVWRTYRDTNFTQAIKRRCRDDALDTLVALAEHWQAVADEPRADQTCAAIAHTFPRDRIAATMPCVAALLPPLPP